MRDCILKLIWPKKDIYAFFEDQGCTKDDLRCLAKHQEEGLSRAAMIDRVFAKLAERPDGGLGAFRAMLQALTNWSHFDSYYFDTLGKLKRDDAQHSMDHLKQLQELRDARMRQERQRHEAAEAAAQKTSSTREELLKKFLSMHGGGIAPTKRGYLLEHILIDLAKLSFLEATEPFRVQGEQIDGAVKYDGEHYLIEAKWQDAAQSNESLYQFAGKVEGKMYGRGLFISVHGFSNHVVHSLVRGKAIKTILVDGEDLVMVLEGHLSFAQLIDRKVKAAQTRGLIYVHPITAIDKGTA